MVRLLAAAEHDDEEEDEEGTDEEITGDSNESGIESLANEHTIDNEEERDDKDEEEEEDDMVLVDHTRERARDLKNENENGRVKRLWHACGLLRSRQSREHSKRVA